MAAMRSRRQLAACCTINSSSDFNSATAPSKSFGNRQPVAPKTTRPDKGESAAAEPVEAKRPAKGGPAEDDDGFKNAFGGGGAPEETKKPEKKNTAVYIPPAPGSGGDVKEELATSDIFEVVVANKPAIAKCADEQHKKDPGSTGKLVMKWTVQTNGRTSAIGVASEEFKGSYFPHCGPELKDYFETLKAFNPDLILTHCRHDLHQDHRVTNELTWNTFRDHTILEYEIPKFDGDLGAPGVFFALTRAEMKRKCDILIECFPSQMQRQWFTRDTFEAIARLRGIECNAPEGYAEAFYSRKLRVCP